MTFENVQSEILNPEIPIVIRTLVTGGFTVDDAQRKPGYILINAHRFDEFGAINSYSFVVGESHLTKNQIDAARIAADHQNAKLVIVGSCDLDVPTMPWSRFINLFGGPVISTSPLEPGFSDELIMLGHDQLPPSLQGNADDLFERYVQVALEFVLGGRVVRYGHDRQFEARPDGIAIPSLHFSALYDAKAYSDGYHITKNSIRQFKSYVSDFTSRYQSYLPALSTFIVVSGRFPHRPHTLDDRSRELFSECRVPLSCLTAAVLADIITIMSEHLQLRHSINWSRIFADPVIQPQRVKSEIEAISRDHIIPRH